MKSKFFYQGVVAVSLTDKGIVVRCFVCRNYDEVLVEMGKLSDNIRVIKMDSCVVLTKYLSRRIMCFSISPIALIYSERVLRSTSSFLADRLAYASHASMIMSEFWCPENETGSLYFGPLRKRSCSLSIRTILRSPVMIWLHGASRNSQQ